MGGFDIIFVYCVSIAKWMPPYLVDVCLNRVETIGNLWYYKLLK